jgi:hypothetical protein
MDGPSQRHDPYGLGHVHAEVHGGLGKLVTTGLQKDRNALVHKVSTSDVRLTLDIEGGLGQVALEVLE